MNDKELRRGEVLGRVKRGELKLSEAARMLDISYRQTKRIWKRYSAGGTKALKHGNVGRVSNRAKPAEVRKRVLQLVREHYSGAPHERFGPTLAAEHLRKDHDLQVSVWLERSFVRRFGGRTLRACGLGRERGSGVGVDPCGRELVRRDSATASWAKLLKKRELSPLPHFTVGISSSHYLSRSRRVIGLLPAPIPGCRLPPLIATLPRLTSA
jgi:transposase